METSSVLSHFDGLRKKNLGACSYLLLPLQIACVGLSRHCPPLCVLYLLWFHIFSYFVCFSVLLFVQKNLFVFKESRLFWFYLNTTKIFCIILYMNKFLILFLASVYHNFYNLVLVSVHFMQMHLGMAFGHLN